MLWDPEVESPASIAVIGAGPVGIEAALYGRFLGYQVELFDTGRPGRMVSLWNERALPANYATITTSLGREALRTQYPGSPVLDLEKTPTGREFADDYLKPLAKTDLLYDFVRFNTEVLEVSRLRCHRNLPMIQATEKYDWNQISKLVDFQERANDEFRLKVRSRDRGEYIVRADIVLDCRGYQRGTAGWGPGSSQSIGAEGVLDKVYRWLPKDSKFEWRHFDNQQAVLFGHTHRAIQFVREWIELFTEHSAKYRLRRLIWVVDEGFECLSDQFGDSDYVSILPTVGIEHIELLEAMNWRLKLVQADDGIVDLQANLFIPFPQVRPTPSIGPELFPQRTFGSLLPETKASCLSLAFQGYTDWQGWEFSTLEPHYYLLGSLSEPDTACGLAEAFEQIRHVFALLGGRRELNLYESFKV